MKVIHASPLFRVKVKAKNEHLVADSGDRLISVRRSDNNGLTGRRALAGLRKVNLNGELVAGLFGCAVIHDSPFTSRYARGLLQF